MQFSENFSDKFLFTEKKLSTIYIVKELQTGGFLWAD